MRRLFFGPTGLSVLVMLLYLGSVLVRSGGDPLAFVRIGAQFEQAGAVDAEGYDGQFVYFIARDPRPESVAPLLDVPAYRYQRILLPLLARAVALGNERAIPWALAGLGLVAQGLGTAAVEKLLERRGSKRWLALVYGLYAGSLLAVRLALPEPLAYLLIAVGLLAGERRPVSKWMAFGLAAFAKEVALVFAGGQLLAYLLRREWGRAGGLLLVAFLPYALFQGWLFVQFGSAGIGSGGANATSFEWIPFMGWLRISEYGIVPLAVFGVIILPFFYFPAIWAALKTVPRLVREPADAAAHLFANAALIPFLPFSTVREPGGLFRFGCGLVLALLVFAAEDKEQRALRYAPLWLALDAVLFLG